MSTLDLVDGVYDLDTEWRGMVMSERELPGLVAAGGFPVKPPGEWFTDPGFNQLTPLTIDNSGRVSGHIAAWHTNHIGMAGGIRPPRSKSKYAFFRTGTIETAEGEFVDVGQITLAGGHAPLEASVPQAVAHYDDTNSAVMDVTAGEDRHGIWVAGGLRPSVTDEQVRAVRASSVSGDWRPINGRLELVAVCAVNCPGFPIPRARVAAGAPIALIAAGVGPIIERAIQLRAEQDVDEGIRAGLHTFRERIAHLESVLLADGGPLATEEAEALRARVHGGTTQEITEDVDARIIELRKRVRPTAEEPPAEPELTLPAPEEVAADAVAAAPIEASLEDTDTTWDDGLDISVPIAAALRTRVHG
jgi:hypothetical protein